VKSPFPPLPTLLICLSAASLSAQGWPSSWLSRVSATQAEQPHWITPVATVTPRLEQEFRFDVLHETIPSGNITNLDNGKGLELIPSRRTELLINLPPYLLHESPAAKDGWGDFSTTLKYRFFAHNEKQGNWILTAFLGGSIPTGTYKNGSPAAVITPTLAGGKGWGWFDFQSTVGGTLPVTNERTVGHTVVSNTAFQVHPVKQIWPEVEINSTFWIDGTNDGRKQTFLTPGVVFGRFPIHKRTAFVAGAGFQIATTHYSVYNHAFIGTLRMPF
jgi:hypothetical protein